MNHFENLLQMAAAPEFQETFSYKLDRDRGMTQESASFIFS